MQQEEEQHFIDELKQFVTENFPLSRMSNEELEENIEALVSERLGVQYCSIEQRVSIVQQERIYFPPLQLPSADT